MEFEFPYPQTVDQALMLLVQILTLLIGFFYLLFPKRMLGFSGIEAIEGKPHAIGEGRSSYAGILIAFGAGCILLQQPGLNLMLAIAWLITGFGISFQISVDGGFNARVIGRMAFSLILAAIALRTVYFLEINLQLPNHYADWIFFGVAALTVVLGLISLVLPKLGLHILKLKPNALHDYAKGEPRGILAGFNLSLGGTYLLFPQGQLFVVLILGGAWLLIGVGRFVSIIVDRGATLYNFAAVIFEVGIGSVLLALILRLI